MHELPPWNMADVRHRLGQPLTALRGGYRCITSSLLHRR
jgi:hypothetical protein